MPDHAAGHAYARLRQATGRKINEEGAFSGGTVGSRSVQQHQKCKKNVDMFALR